MNGEGGRPAERLRDDDANAPLRLLVSGVAHQLRNPLFGMSAAIDALELRLGPGVDPTFFAVLRGQMGRVGGVVQELIDYADPSPMALAEGSVAAVVHDALERCRAAAERRALTVEVTREPPSCTAAVDAPRLALAIARLLEDACEHAPAGSRVRVVMGLLLRAETPWFQCAIEDDGPSFSEEGLVRAFEPFYPRRRAAGGLGLAIASRVVAAHGGELVAANRPARGGATMTLRLPCSSVGRAATEPPSGPGRR